VLAVALNNLYESAMNQTTASPAGAGDAPAAHLQAIQELAASLQGNPEALLALLRDLEQVHRSIQDGPFRSSLPADRNQLYRLLAEMERSGGWPYIPRLQLRTFLDLLQSKEELAVAVVAEPDPEQPDPAMDEAADGKTTSDVTGGGGTKHHSSDPLAA
jgi:hypothetical protein